MMENLRIFEAWHDRHGEWDQWAMEHPFGTLFHTMRWMDDRPEGPTGLLLAENGGQIVGGFAWHRTVRYGLARVLPPKLTPHFGPLADPTLAAADRTQICHALLEALPSHDLVGLLVDREADSDLLSGVVGGRQKAYPTRRKKLAPDKDSIAGYSDNIRRNIRQALAQGAKPAPEVDPDEAFALFEGAYAQRGSAPNFTATELRILYERLVLSGEAVIQGVVDGNGLLAGALLLLSDRKSVYYMVSGTDRDLLSGKAGALMVHMAIRFAQDRGLVFDFNGSSIPGIMEFFDRFGPEPAEVLYLTRARTLKGSLGLAAGKLLGKRVI